MEDFKKVYELYFEDVFKYLRSITMNQTLAAELTSDVFFKAMKNVKNFRGDCDVRVWLCQIGKNLYFDYLKKQDKITSMEEMDNQKTDGADIKNLLVDKETALDIHKHLHDLPEPYKEVFSLRVFRELSFADIGILFDKTEHWACVIYHRAKEKIQRSIRED